ncbi:hypothetical protein B0A52_06095 [Exophiala mesophila]|uniref:SET domain-containing protein n=1 Tax=Exophiala mesophila TaxID=212818 RepID=A0A438N596_EXOME|nr:hypothetical protein B0A52_06095 [Exophiala mesophila]
MRHESMPIDHLYAWAELNQVKLIGTTVEPHILAPDGSDKGGGLVVKTSHGPGEALLRVPLDLVLSKERVYEYAKADKQLKELLEAIPPLLQTPRAAVVLFLVYCMTINVQKTGFGLHGPFADYVKFLPKDIPGFPTFYSPDERDLLLGTSLSSALDDKLASLEREFQSLKESSRDIPWCQKVWWDDESGILDLEDWKLADALYRSRALDLPRGSGVGMVPVVDMANHASDDRYNARFEVDEDQGQVLLVVRDDRTIAAGDEATIMYGVGGACEMIFSYGFLEEHASSAREIFLGLSIPADDPLRRAKIWFAEEAPGVRLYIDEADQIRWESTFVWWACVNHEDGLDFLVEKTVDGDTDLKATFDGQDLIAEQLPSRLQQHDLHEVFLLRAVVMIQEVVAEQGEQLAQSQLDFDALSPNTQIRQYVYETVGRLRRLEMSILTRAYEALGNQKEALLKSDVVCRYLKQGDDVGEAASLGDTEGDFS